MTGRGSAQPTTARPTEGLGSGPGRGEVHMIEYDDAGVPVRTLCGMPVPADCVAVPDGTLLTCAVCEDIERGLASSA